MHLRTVFRLFAPLALLLLAACAPAPIYKAAPGTVTPLPMQVAHAPEQYGNSSVIWGGSVVAVRNFPGHTEMEILGYPLDSSQRPQPNAQGIGRFIAVFPGYLEAFNYPNGSLVTLTGQLSGTRTGSVDQAAYTYPVVSVAQSHLWTQAELRQGHPNVSFGVGVGVGIH
ncbi:Slp family lipoprotein [Dyella nitratireducens]|uniref:Membrane protein n=1 Tax=Dyella nitratireducens TaxID=1849580 RepID=A0ABQ1FKN7_9GAMM|nr:Slp family lipoprotein [Dyella nitratireducens]GGA20338.1 membrane protein [Dyella nitratireducens]GLQ44392.1 membrane protein [Dyella nitratireducens]